LDKQGFDDRLSVILLDHQPAHLEEASRAGVDLQLSGHTHAGQLFPLDLINRMVWELNWGYLRKGDTQYYVTSGVGTWGPPVRTGSRPEIVRIHLTFGEDGP
jgi:predicted MPP superfamily phosphohydrolase